MITASFLQWLYFCAIVLAFFAAVVVVMVAIWGLIIGGFRLYRLLCPEESS